MDDIIQTAATISEEMESVCSSLSVREVSTILHLRDQMFNDFISDPKSKIGSLRQASCVALRVSCRKGSFEKRVTNAIGARLKEIKTAGFLLLLFSLSVTFCFAQKGATERSATAKAAQEKAQRIADEEAVRKMPDPGADTAFVVALKANIRQEPNRTGRILLEVERSEALSLVEREPTGTWYRVIHVESAVEGWIDQSVVVTKLTANRYTAPDFDEEASESYSNPTVKITNREKATDLNLRMNGVLYVIEADTTRSFTVPPGPYEYYGWSPGVRATFGKSSLSKGTIYSWTFFIRRR